MNDTTADDLLRRTLPELNQKWPMPPNTVVHLSTYDEIPSLDDSRRELTMLAAAAAAASSLSCLPTPP
jgi:hypothetical protein